MADSKKTSLSIVIKTVDQATAKIKAINDRHGHDVGDALLVVVSQRMKGALREADSLARLGGDEFVAVLADLDRAQDAEPVLERLAAMAPREMRRAWMTGFGNARLEGRSAIDLADLPDAPGKRASIGFVQ